jgi:hypothetical protein
MVHGQTANKKKQSLKENREHRASLHPPLPMLHPEQ